MELSREKNKIKGDKHLHVGWLIDKGFRLNAQILRAGILNAGSLTRNRLTSRTPLCGTIHSHIFTSKGEIRSIGMLQPGVASKRAAKDVSGEVFPILSLDQRTKLRVHLVHDLCLWMECIRVKLRRTICAASISEPCLISNLLDLVDWQTRSNMTAPLRSPLGLSEPCCSHDHNIASDD